MIRSGLFGVYCMISSYNKPGFYYGYLIVAASFTLQAVGWGLYNSFGVFLNPVMTEFAWPRAVISSGISLSMFVFGLFAILQGRLNDRFGPRIIMTGSGILLGAGYLLMSRASTVWHLYLFFGLMVGIGVSGTDVVLLSTTARWFDRKRGMMTGIIKVGTGVGMLVMPLLIHHLVTGYGWRNAFIALAVMVLFFYVVFSQILVRDPSVRDRPSVDGKREKHVNPMSFEEGMSLQETARTLQFWTICLSYFMVFFCASTILMHIVPHAIDMGISAADAAKVLSALGASSIAGRFIMGSAGDKIGNKPALVITFLCLASSLIWLQVSNTLWMLFLFALAYGFSHGGFFSLSSPLIADLFGTRAHGIIFGIVVFASTVGGSSGPVTAGYIFDMTGSYRTSFLILNVMSILGLIAAITLKPITNDFNSACDEI